MKLDAKKAEVAEIDALYERKKMPAIECSCRTIEGPGVTALPDHGISQTQLLSDQPQPFEAFQESTLRSDVENEHIRGASLVTLFLVPCTLAALMVFAWFVAYDIRPRTYAGIKTSLAMGLVLIVLALVCYVDDLRRPGGTEDNTWIRFLSSMMRKEKHH